MSASNNQRYDVTYSGRVQGVGFRYTVQRLASPLNLTGYVRNLASGDVRLEVEGAEREIKALLASINSAMKTKIDDAKIDTRPGTGEFTGFEIRY